MENFKKNKNNVVRHLISISIIRQITDFNRLKFSCVKSYRGVEVSYLNNLH